MKKYFLPFLLLTVSLTTINFSFAQGVAVNTTGNTADPSAMLDVNATNKGILIPRVTSTSSITSPVVGLLIFQTTAPIGFYYYDGAAWDYLQNSANANVTLKGNVFNGNNQLVLLDGSGRLPAIDGSLLTNLPAGGAAAAGTLTGSTLASNVVNASITRLSPLTSNGIVTTNGGTGALSVTGTTGSGSVVLATSPTLVTPNLGTPSSLVGTNISGTAANLTAGNVTTDANLTGDVTSVGNATTIAASAVTSGKLADGSVTIAKINTTSGTASSTTFLEGDGKWATPASGGGSSTLELDATVNAQTIAVAAGVVSNLACTSSTVAGGTFNNATGTFTVTSAGLYLVTVVVNTSSAYAFSPQLTTSSYTAYGVSAANANYSPGPVGRANISAVFNLAASGTITLQSSSPLPATDNMVYTGGRFMIVKL